MLPAYFFNSRLGLIQSLEPFISSHDIDRGTDWLATLGDQLKDTNIGIICLTPENLESTWIHYEAGALSKLQKESRAYTLLYDVQPSNIEYPLAKFQHTKFEKTDIHELIKSINKAQGENALNEQVVNKAFERGWTELNDTVKQATSKLVNNNASKSQKIRSEREILEEVLDLIRNLSLPRSSLAGRLLPRAREIDPFGYIRPDPVEAWGEASSIVLENILRQPEQTLDSFFRETKVLLVSAKKDLQKTNFEVNSTRIMEQKLKEALATLSMRYSINHYSIEISNKFLFLIIEIQTLLPKYRKRLAPFDIE